MYFTKSSHNVDFYLEIKICNRDIRQAYKSLIATFHDKDPQNWNKYINYNTNQFDDGWKQIDLKRIWSLSKICPDIYQHLTRQYTLLWPPYLMARATPGIPVFTVSCALIWVDWAQVKVCEIFQAWNRQMSSNKDLIRRW